MLVRRSLPLLNFVSLLDLPLLYIVAGGALPHSSFQKKIVNGFESWMVKDIVGWSKMDFTLTNIFLIFCHMKCK
jgi:hypothetical protein